MAGSPLTPDSGDLLKRHSCTKADPWTPEKGRFAEHRDAVCVISGDYVDYYECPNCGHKWGEELPE